MPRCCLRSRDPLPAGPRFQGGNRIRLGRACRRGARRTDRACAGQAQRVTGKGMGRSARRMIDASRVVVRRQVRFGRGQQREPLLVCQQCRPQVGPALDVQAPQRSGHGHTGQGQPRAAWHRARSALRDWGWLVGPRLLRVLRGQRLRCDPVVRLAARMAPALGRRDHDVVAAARPRGRGRGQDAGGEDAERPRSCAEPAPTGQHLHASAPEG
jgi:hypothetical protein